MTKDERTKFAVDMQSKLSEMDYEEISGLLQLVNDEIYDRQELLTEKDSWNNSGKINCLKNAWADIEDAKIELYGLDE